MKSIVRKQIDGKTKQQDLVQTDPRMVMVLADWIKKNIPDYHHMKLLDPCCGYGVIWKGLQEVLYNIQYFDKYIGRKTQNYLLKEYSADIISFNPPYSNKYKFMNKAFNEARYVFCLLPLNTRNYICIHEDYEDISSYVGYIKMSPKINLSSTGTHKRGGNSMYCWLIWDTQGTYDRKEFWLANLDDYGELNNS